MRSCGLRSPRPNGHDIAYTLFSFRKGQTSNTFALCCSLRLKKSVRLLAAFLDEDARSSVREEARGVRRKSTTYTAWATGTRWVLVGLAFPEAIARTRLRVSAV